MRKDNSLLNDPQYPRPRSIRPKIILATGCVRFVVFDWKNDLYWTGENDWGKESEAKIYSSLHDALTSVRLLKYRCRWTYLMAPDPGPEFWN